MSGRRGLARKEGGHGTGRGKEPHSLNRSCFDSQTICPWSGSSLNTYRFCFFADTFSIGTPCRNSCGTVASVPDDGCATGAMSRWYSFCKSSDSFCCCCSDAGDSGSDAILVSGGGGKEGESTKGLSALPRRPPPPGSCGERGRRVAAWGGTRTGRGGGSSAA